MRFPLLSLLILCAAADHLPAQIYADFTVSHGATPLGTFRVRLEHEKAPRPVAAFIGLATGQRNWIDVTTGQVKINTPFYNGQVFPRLEHNFVLQGGDPLGTTLGGPGYVFQDQFHPDLRHTGRYILTMARGDQPNSNGSQFFITLARASVPDELAKVAELDDRHSVFGEVINDATHPNGRTLIDNFANPALFPTTGESPTAPVNLDSVVISGPSLASFDIHDPAFLLPTVRPMTFLPDYDGTSRFKLLFPREMQREYAIATAPDLNLALQQYLLSMDSAPGHEFSLSGITTSQFFARVAEVDYSLLPNPPTALLSAGSTFTLTDRSANTLTLTFDGPSPTTGTWSDSLGNSGTLTFASWLDRVPASGKFAQPSSQATFIPLGNLLVEFDGPAGPRAITNLDVTVSFHSPTSGRVESTTFLPDGKRLLQSFSYTP